MCGGSRPHCGGIDARYLLLKVTLGIFATFFWLLGLLILCIGIYAEVERQRNKTMDGFFIAPAIILLLLGLGMFTVSFAGMIGALRDNRLLLKVFKWTLVTVVVLQLIFVIVSVLCRNKVLLLFKANVREGIKHYYDDLDFKNILDRIQIKFSCCGGDDYMDWAVNQYHACDAPGPLACGAPYTCCVRNQGDVINTQCGYQTLQLERSEVDGIIHARGCVDAVNLWFLDNIGITAGILAALLLPQFAGIVLSCMYLKILSQHMDELDGFRMVIPYELLDLSGAGWCLCLPREGGYQQLQRADSNADFPVALDSAQEMQLISTEQGEVNRQEIPSVN
ncbi:tetraspanin-15 isoform X1 [Chiloscyllium plagiosum]|uniref:tetraspanin-15 isoform X1 n=1 Tax=Chiloscyllium plagiosum TaxID=36176 RepID=UPI001CB87953|nr:tetraspanin-15 isoform X1 [Chiloscyllium plagiosum]XP_043537423.1 tetraspanin-15 isoform X1 [Chiloscyllium plagiosum]XP_043537424.1 tetraspanin-15 isoform X1 [Chiloscyllium plagiosum]